MLAAEAIATQQSWVHKLGRVPREPRPAKSAGCETSRPSPPTGTDGTSMVLIPSARWPKRGNPEQMDQRQRALAAARRAVASGREVHDEQASCVWVTQVEEVKGVEL